MRSRADMILAAIALALSAFGCRARNDTHEGPVARPRADLALSGQAYAQRVRDAASLPGGPGAEGTPGDFLLENSAVQFVIAGAARAGWACPTGNLIDAAHRGGQDRLRLLVTSLSTDAPLRPVYTDVRVAREGGQDAVASVQAEGHLPTMPDIRVKTTYSLRPESTTLEIDTLVENRSADMLVQLGLGDALYYGRSFLYSPTAGLFPWGRQAASRWICFFYEGQVCALIVGPLSSMECIFEPGVSWLRYATVDVPPGGTRGYRRYFSVSFGGPDQAWLQAHSVSEEQASALTILVKDSDSGKAVSDALVALQPTGQFSPLIAQVGPSGRAELRLAPGWYQVAATAPGRARPGPVTVRCEPYAAHALTIPMTARSEAVVTTRIQVDDFRMPTSSRITVHPAGMGSVAPGHGPGFPAAGLGGAILASPSSPAIIPLAPAGEQMPGVYFLTASKGPLFELAGVRLEVMPGQTLTHDLILPRVVNPGRYVAVDFRQHSDASPDGALTVGERMLANACEGLDGAVVSDPVHRLLFPEATGPGECPLMPGYRAQMCGVGSFSVFPLGSRARQEAELTHAFSPGRQAADALAAARQMEPDAIIQVDAPLRKSTGHFALTGFSPSMGNVSPPGLALDFDAIEILTGADVASANALLQHWFFLLNQGRKVFVTGSSGSRGIAGDFAGLARTFIDCPRRGPLPTAEELAAAIRALKQVPNAFVTNGPFVEANLNGQSIGSTQTIGSGKALLQVRVTAPTWVDVTRVTIYRNGLVEQEFDVPPAAGPLRCDRAFELGIPADSWFVIQVTGAKPMAAAYGPSAPTPWALTNPFWVDADGDGTVRIGPPLQVP